MENHLIGSCCLTSPVPQLVRSRIMRACPCTPRQTYVLWCSKPAAAQVRQAGHMPLSVAAGARTSDGVISGRSVTSAPSLSVKLYICCGNRVSMNRRPGVPLLSLSPPANTIQAMAHKTEEPAQTTAKNVAFPLEVTAHGGPAG